MRWGPAALLAVALGLLLTALSAPPALAAGDRRSPLPAAAQPTPAARSASVLVDVLDPASGPERGVTLTVGGTVVNTGTSALSRVSVRLRLGQALQSRSQMEQQSRAFNASTGVVGRAVDVTANLPAGASAPFTLQVQLPTAGTPGRDGVYPMQVEATSQGGRVGTADTFLPWFPDAPPAPLTVSWVIPLAGPPRVAGPSTLTDDDVLADIAPDGRIGQLLSAVAAVPQADVTLALEPTLLEAAQIAAGPHQVLDAAGRPGPTLPGDPRATAFLELLRQVTADTAPIALPYADADVVALTRTGMEADVTATLREGQRVVARILGREPDTTLAWPAAGLITPQALGVLADSDVSGVVLSDTALPVDWDRQTYTPTAVTTLPGSTPMTGLAVDGGVAATVDKAQKAAATPRLAEQLVLSQLDMITAEQPALARALVVAPPRTWAADGTWLTRLLRDTAAGPGTTTATLHAAAHLQPGTERGPLTYPADAVRAELPAGSLEATARLRDEVREFRRILPEPSAAQRPSEEPLTGPLVLALYRSESAAWRSDPGGGDAERGRAATELTDLRNRLHIDVSQTVTLTSRSGRVPVTVVNDLPEAVHVTLAMTAGNGVKLRATTSADLVVPANTRTQTDLQAVAESSGTFPGQLHLLGPDGQPLGVVVSVNVRSTAYGVIALGLTFGALGVLVLAIAVRLFRRWRRHRRGAPDEAAAPGDSPGEATSVAPRRGRHRAGAATHPRAVP